MENIHFSIQDLMGIMSFTICLIYLLQILLINMFPPKTNKYFAIHFGLLAFILLGFLIKHFIGESLFFIFLPLFLISMFIISPLMWNYVQNVLVPVDRNTKTFQPIVRALFIGEIGFVLFLVVWLSSIIYPQSKTDFLSIIDFFLIICLFVLLPIQSMYYSYNSIKLYRAFRKSPQKFSQKHEKAVLNWIRILVFGYLGLIIAVLISVVLEEYIFKGLSYVSVLLYLIIIGTYILKQKDQFIEKELKKQLKKDKEESILNSEKYKTYLELKLSLMNLVETEQLYLNKALTIHEMASLLGTNSKYLSETINTLLNQSFVSFINNYRVSHARKLLSDPENNHYTLETIGEMSGFNSKSSFYAVFKKVEGITPSKYKLNQQDQIKKKIKRLGGQ